MNVPVLSMEMFEEMPIVRVSHTTPRGPYLEKLKSYVRDGDLILLVDIHTGRESIAYGFEALRACAERILPAALTVRPIKLGIDFATEDLEFALALIEVTKGFHEYEEAQRGAKGRHE
jgi:hypothetical protein